jgi:SAM-dependent methyltransferase
MMAEINLLRSLPRTARNIQERNAAKDPAVIAIANEFGAEYWDGDRKYGYGGYRYDGRWRSVARDMIAHFSLRPDMRVLDVGCGKGFLVKDRCSVPWAWVLPVDTHILMHCGRWSGACASGAPRASPFPDGSFDAVVSINTIHNLDRAGVVQALREIERVAPGRAFVQVDAYHTAEERELFMQWVLTAKFHDYPSGWLGVFEEAGYTGDWSWTVLER